MPQLRQLDGVFLKIGGTPLGETGVIAVTLNGREKPALLRKAKRLGAKIFELRIDRFPKLPDAQLVPKVRSYRKFGLPLIATIRAKKEGGERAVSERERLELFRKILPSVDALDLELASTRLTKILGPLARRRGKRLILSFHDFKKMPPERKLTALIRKAKKRGADIVKIAVTPKKTNDVARLLLFTQRFRNDRLITIAMGRLGRPGRILAPLFGSLLTYSFVGKSQAPGQIPLKRLVQELGR